MYFFFWPLCCLSFFDVWILIPISYLQAFLIYPILFLFEFKSFKCVLLYILIMFIELSPLICIYLMWVRIPLKARYTTSCDKVCQRLAAGRWFSPGSLVPYTNKTDCHDITEILLKVAINTIKTKPSLYQFCITLMRLRMVLIFNDCYIFFLYL